ncbi:MAG: hypothetical protein HDQ99_19945 [Lachnospiraceae bacterium]|nr:hypothetical protein [Lachnospiraceae bacterium]
MEKRTHEEFIDIMNTKNPNIKILGKYVNAKIKIKCKCNIDQYEWETTPDHLVSGSGCPLCAKIKRDKSHKMKTHNQYVEDCKQVNPNIEIIGHYDGVMNNIKCHCKICGGNFIRRASKTIEGVGCPICSGIKVCNGINDIATTHPELVKYFKNKQESTLYSKGSTSSIMLKCPDCGYEKSEEISKFVSRGYMSCPKCSDGISYPNKFARAFLDQLNIENVEYEYSPEWAKPYRYDNYFEYNGKKYILEMDGGFHYIKYYKSNLSLEETQEIDRLKDSYAISNDIIIRRINCFYSNPKYIESNIKKSILSSIFNLDQIDWKLCDKKASNSLVKQVCDVYNENPTLSNIFIAKIFNIDDTTVSKYLYKGNVLGFCNYKPHNKIPIEISFGNTKFTFSTINECIRKIPYIYDKKMNISQFKTALHNKELLFDDISITYI